MQNYLSPYSTLYNNILGFSGVPPSRLGFVCKPDMPPHINILFRARPPMEFVPLPSKGKCRKYEGILGFNKDVLDKLEKTPPAKRPPVETKRSRRLKTVIEKIEKNKVEKKEIAKECKYLIIKYLSVRDIFPIFIYS